MEATRPLPDGSSVDTMTLWIQKETLRETGSVAKSYNSSRRKTFASSHIVVAEQEQNVT
jgi:hypothetical protein